MNSKYKNILLSFSLLFLIILSSCEHKNLCPAYMKRDNGTVSVVDGAQTAEDVRKQSLEQLENMSYVRVKRDKKSGLVTKSKRFKRKKKKGKNYTKSKKRKDYNVSPDLKGLDQ